MKKVKWITLVLLATSTATFGGCVSAFWQGMWNTGWPTNNPWLNLGSDIVNEMMLG